MAAVERPWKGRKESCSNSEKIEEIRINHVMSCLFSLTKDNEEGNRSQHRQQNNVVEPSCQLM